MEVRERQFAVGQLQSSEADLLKLLDGLRPAQWYFHESPLRWSIAQNLEHLILFEGFILSRIKSTLEAPPEPHKRSGAPTKEPLVLGLATSRDTKFSARELVRPAGRWDDPAAMIAEFRHARAQTIDFATHTQASLREHFFPHIAFGDLDCYQWLIVLGQHTLRHACQIEQIKADPAYPRP